MRALKVFDLGLQHVLTDQTDRVTKVRPSDRQINEAPYNMSEPCRVTSCRGSCGSCGEVAGTKDKGSRLDFNKACVMMLERLKIGGIILKSNVYERETNIYKR